MNALWFLLALAGAFVAGWFCCSYFEELHRSEERRYRRAVARREAGR
jgi:hypothetical protein